MRKVYKVLLILFFVCLINLFLTSVSYAELKISLYDEEKNVISDGDTIECIVGKDIKLTYRSK